MGTATLVRRLALPLIAIVAVAVIGAAAAVAATSSSEPRAELNQVRDATDAFHNLDLALAAGYESFYLCTDQARVGGMGQHYVKGALVEDPALDKLRPEVLVFEPRRDGGYQLVAVEYVVLKDAWHKANGSKTPRLFGKRLKLVTAPNRYGLPDFYELHAWIWKGNPRGVFDDWNPNVSCRGMGDPA
jgi:hypothetical protein